MTLLVGERVRGNRFHAVVFFFFFFFTCGAGVPLILKAAVDPVS